MEIIPPCVKLIDEKDPFKKIELCGRVFYKSEYKITKDSALRFYSVLVKSNHTAMLEHATFVFHVGPRLHNVANTFPFLHCTYNTSENRYLVSGNLRAINESGITELLYELAKIHPALAYSINEEKLSRDYAKATGYAQCVNFETLGDLTAGEIAAHRYTTIRFVTDRGVTHELVRHRPFSFVQESTRYCNLTNEKFGGNIKFIEPAGYASWTAEMRQALLSTFSTAETCYNRMMQSGATAQQARAVLPSAVKTEIIVTGHDAEWQHFFNLRSKGTTGAPHPDMKIVADKALQLYTKYYNR